MSLEWSVDKLAPYHVGHRAALALGMVQRKCSSPPPHSSQVSCATRATQSVLAEPKQTGAVGKFRPCSCLTREQTF
jgi:hypothetical protein